MLEAAMPLRACVRAITNNFPEFEGSDEEKPWRMLHHGAMLHAKKKKRQSSEKLTRKTIIADESHAENQFKSPPSGGALEHKGSSKWSHTHLISSIGLQPRLMGLTQTALTFRHTAHATSKRMTTRSMARTCWHHSTLALSRACENLGWRLLQRRLQHLSEISCGRNSL